jgi:Fic family protein
MGADTHHFISFEFTTASLSSDIWFLLGEAFSKCQHLAGSPLKPGTAADMAAVALARGVQATTAIEGNTLSEDEVTAIVRRGSAHVSASREYLEREVKNILSALAEIDKALHEGRALPIDRDRLCALNAQILAGIPDRPEVKPGHLREHDVVAGPYRAPHWTSVPDLVNQFVTWLREVRADATELRPEDRFVNAVLAAILAHLYIAWIHPFGNGNGRLARLVEVQILSESGVVPEVSTNLLSDHYNKTRAAYYLALEEAQRDVPAFVTYAVRGFVEELRMQIESVKSQSLSVHWESYVYEVFRGMPTTSARDRQRELALALAQRNIAVTKDEATDLTASLARKYARAGDRTPARDLNDLVGMGLARRAGNRRYETTRDTIRAFIPAVSHTPGPARTSR